MKRKKKYEKIEYGGKTCTRCNIQIEPASLMTNTKRKIEFSFHMTSCPFNDH